MTDTTFFSEVPTAKITLRDGRTLSCTPYVSDKGTMARNKVSRKQCGEDMEYFLKHAFFFFANRERIYSDSRLFLSRVPINTGLGAFDDHDATLGAYLEMWEYFDNAVTQDKDGNVAFLIEATGSPLSGSCSLAVVNEKGKRSIIRTGHLTQYLRTLGSAHDRYRKQRETSWAYSVKQVYDILQAEKNGNKQFEKNIRMEVLQKQVCLLANKQKKLEEDNKKMKQTLYETRLQLKQNEILDYVRRKKEYEESIREELNEIHEKCLAIKREYAGQHSNKEFQILYIPLKKRERELKQSIYNFDLAGFRKIWPWGRLSSYTIEKIIEDAE